MSRVSVTPFDDISLKGTKSAKTISRSSDFTRDARCIRILTFSPNYVVERIVTTLRILTLISMALAVANCSSGVQTTGALQNTGPSYGNALQSQDATDPGKLRGEGGGGGGGGGGGM